MCCFRTTWTKRSIVFFWPSSFRLPGMAPKPFFSNLPLPPSFSFLISQIKLTPHLTHQRIWLLQLTNYQKNMSGRCHRHRATQHRRPQRAQISLETPCPFFLSHRGRLASLRLSEQGCWSFSILLFLFPSLRHPQRLWMPHFAFLFFFWFCCLTTFRWLLNIMHCYELHYLIKHYLRSPSTIKNGCVEGNVLLMSGVSGQNGWRPYLYPESQGWLLSI